MLLSGHDNEVPIASLPVTIRILLLADMVLEPELRAQLDLALADDGLVSSRQPAVHFEWIYVETTNNCASVADIVKDSDVHGVLALVDSDCRVMLETTMAAMPAPLMFIGQGRSSEYSALPMSFTMDVPTTDSMLGVGRILSNFNWRRPAILTTAALTNAETQAFGPVGLSRTVILTHTNFVNCTAHPDIVQAVAALKDARTPIIVIDV